MEVPELIDEFVGDWRLVEVSRDESATKPEGLEQTRFSFNADDTGELTSLTVGRRPGPTL